MKQQFVRTATLATAIFLIVFPSVSSAQTTTALSGYCDSVSNVGQQFVLYGLGQRAAATYQSGKQYTACTYGPGTPNPSAFLGELVTQNGTIKNLYVKQTQLNSAPMGGTVAIWVNPRTGGDPIQTSISCSLAFSSSSLYLCNNTGASYSVVAGDRVIAIGTPLVGQSISPVSVTLDLATSTTSVQPFTGNCVSTSNPGQSFVLNGLGQTADPNCVYSPGNPVSPILGQIIQRSGTLRNLNVKQQQLNSAPFGGTIQVWVNPKTGGFPIQTSIGCTLGFYSSDLYACSNTSNTYAVSPGDRVIVIVSPPAGTSISPVSAEIDVAF